MPGQLPRAARRREARVQDAALRRAHGNGAIGSLITRREGIERAFHRINRIGMGVIHHAIDAAIHLLGTAGEINMHRLTLDGDGAGDARNRLIKAIGFQGGMPGTIRECRDGAAHGGIRPLM